MDNNPGLSLISYQQIVHNQTCFGELIVCTELPSQSDKQYEIASAQQQIPQHFDSKQANGSIHVLPIAHIIFTSYGTA